MINFYERSVGVKFDSGPVFVRWLSLIIGLVESRKVKRAPFCKEAFGVDFFRLYIYVLTLAMNERSSFINVLQPKAGFVQ